MLFAPLEAACLTSAKPVHGRRIEVTEHRHMDRILPRLLRALDTRECTLNEGFLPNYS